MNSSGVTGQSTSEQATDSESEDESSSRGQEDIEDVLASFREKWQRELKISKEKRAQKSDDDEDAVEDIDMETTAKKLFLNGVDLEKHGKFYEAIQFYRRAERLVPDIQFKIKESLKSSMQKEMKEFDENIFVGDEREDSSVTSNSDDEEDTNLSQRIQRKMNKVSYLCLPDREVRESHISVLPMEIILYILRWVVSSDLDVRSLEMFSMACRGFYLCARDPKIWKSVCERVWGVNCGSLPCTYSSWREMFLERAKLHYHGCYISKTTYIRPGESSFQDQFYKPWHLVAYYRYLRFFPDGLVLMLTTAEEPSQSVHLLKNRNPKTQTILIGHYRLKDDIVTIFVRRQEQLKQIYKRTRRRDIGYDNNNEQTTFHIEFRIRNHNRKKHVQLVWMKYCIYTLRNGIENQCNYDLAANRFPPLWFSRVKSYSLESEYPLI